jgi:hypothetical protein
MPVVSALRRLRQEHFKFQVHLSLQSEMLSQKNQKTNQNESTNNNTPPNLHMISNKLLANIYTILG